MCFVLTVETNFRKFVRELCQIVPMTSHPHDPQIHLSWETAREKLIVLGEQRKQTEQKKRTKGLCSADKGSFRAAHFTQIQNEKLKTQNFHTDKVDRRQSLKRCANIEPISRGPGPLVAAKLFVCVIKKSARVLGNLVIFYSTVCQQRI